jgi:uncharacterized membrane-anchored protein
MIALTTRIGSWAMIGLLAAAALPAPAAPPRPDKPQPGPEAEPPAKSAEPKIPGVKWQKGPCSAKLGEQATLQLPKGFLFTDGEGTRKVMEVMQNPTDGSELGMIYAEDGWFVVFEFDDSGYVSDDEKTSLDADAMLKAIRSGTEESNKERKSRGWSTMTILGWQEKPNFDSESKNLQWAILGQSEGDKVVNYNTRILGRRGVMSANLVADPEELGAAVPEYKSLLKKFSYSKGNTYAEFRKGDKIAKYGLTALITGGAAAVAIKSGLLPKLLKGGVVLVVGAAAAVKKFFRRGQ